MKTVCQFARDEQLMARGTSAVESNASQFSHTDGGAQKSITMASRGVVTLWPPGGLRSVFFKVFSGIVIIAAMRSLLKQWILRREGETEFWFN